MENLGYKQQPAQRSIFNWKQASRSELVPQTTSWYSLTRGAVLTSPVTQTLFIGLVGIRGEAGKVEALSLVQMQLRYRTDLEESFQRGGAPVGCRKT